MSNLMEVDVLRMLRYCRMSGTVIRRRARRNRSPVLKSYLLIYFSFLILLILSSPIYVWSKYSTFNNKHLGFIHSYQSMFYPSRWRQRRVGWWSSRQRSRLPAWTRTCQRPQWTGIMQKLRLCFPRRLFLVTLVALVSTLLSGSVPRSI